MRLLDGVGAGICGALFSVIVVDLTRGGGRFNAAQGAMATAQGLGAALSATFAGLIIVSAGHDAAFLTLAATAASALPYIRCRCPRPATRPQSRPALRSPGDRLTPTSDAIDHSGWLGMPVCRERLAGGAPMAGGIALTSIF